MRILITGVAGLVGSWLSDALCADPSVERVIGIDDLSGGEIENVNVSRSHKFSFEQFTLSHKGKVAEVCAQFRPHIVVHAAACAREGASTYQPVKIVETNVMISAILLEHAIHYGMKKFVMFSSMAVMGDQKSPFVETMSMAPVDPYGISKAATEGIIRALGSVHGFDWTVIRPHNIVGPRQSLSDRYRNVAGIWMNSIMRHEPLYLFGEATKRAFSYIEDSLPAMKNAVLGDKANGKVVFVGGKEEILVEDLLHEVIGCFPEYKTPEIIRCPLRPLEVKEAFCSTELSVKLLGYKEEVGWKNGIARMAEWAKKKGSQQWRLDTLPLANAGMPRPWQQ